VADISVRTIPIASSLNPLPNFTTTPRLKSVVLPPLENHYQARFSFCVTRRAFSVTSALVYRVRKPSRVAHAVPRICAALPAPHEASISISILTTLRVPQHSCHSDGSSREQGPRLSSSFRQWATHSLGDPSLPPTTSRMRRRLYDSPFFPTLW
jgi:hypothetical protein